MMDQWMDQAEAREEGKAVDVQLKRCPRCSTPIRTCLRYGNIIKKILTDFEQIKRKILLGNEQRVMAVNRLRLKIRKIEKFPEDQVSIIESLEHKNLTDEQINVFENQISFLSFLQTLKAKVEISTEAENARLEKSLPERAADKFLVQETKADLESLVEKIRNLVMKFRARFSDQELEELNEEIYRTQLAVDLKILKMQLNIRDIMLDATLARRVDRVQKALDSEKPIGKRNQDSSLGCIFLRHFKRQCPLRPSEIENVWHMMKNQNSPFFAQRYPMVALETWWHFC